MGSCHARASDAWLASAAREAVLLDIESDIKRATGALLCRVRQNRNVTCRNLKFCKFPTILAVGS